MRKQLIVIALALFLVGSYGAVFADEAVLIDFSQLKADIPDPNNQSSMVNNKATMMDFSGTAGASYTDDQKKQMRTSLAIRNWDVVLSSSSKTTTNQALSLTAEAPVASGKYKDQAVMGIRVHFPVAEFNSWARIQPPFEIPAFERTVVDGQGNVTDPPAGTPNSPLTRFEGNYDQNTKITTALGVVKNVGVIKSVAVTVRGLNFPHGLSVVLKDADGNEQTLFMGYLNFDGWKELVWNNPAYVTDVRNRELRIFPLYPKSTPMIKLAGFLVTRDAASEGGDFVTYIKDVKILYDEAVIQTGRDIDDENIWGIVNKKETERKNIESKAFGAQQVLRYLEETKEDQNANPNWAETPAPTK
jgi:hypothetical protein